MIFFLAVKAYEVSLKMEIFFLELRKFPRFQRKDFHVFAHFLDIYMVCNLRAKIGTVVMQQKQKQRRRLKVWILKTGLNHFEPEEEDGETFTLERAILIA